MRADSGTREDRSRSPKQGGFVVPERLRARLEPWIDVAGVGETGFWQWLETVLPALPTPDDRPAGRSSSDVPDSVRVRELARDLVGCAQERARLTFQCDLYFRDNQVLAVRTKSLEAALRTPRTAGPPSEVTDDRESSEAAERYLPKG